MNLSKVDYDAIPDSEVAPDPSNDVKNEMMQHRNITTDNKEHKEE